MHIRVFNYNTLERAHQFEAHSDYLRSIAVHPSQPYILTSSGEQQNHADLTNGTVCSRHPLDVSTIIVLLLMC